MIDNTRKASGQPINVNDFAERLAAASTWTERDRLKDEFLARMRGLSAPRNPTE